MKKHSENLQLENKSEKKHAEKFRMMGLYPWYDSQTKGGVQSRSSADYKGILCSLEGVVQLRQSHQAGGKVQNEFSAS